MAQKYIFNTVGFGGFDKEEVLEFIKTTIDEYDEKENTYKGKIADLENTIEDLNKQIESLTDRNSELSKAISTNASTPSTDDKYNKDAISDSILFTKKTCDKLVADTKAHCNKLIEDTEKICRQKKMVLYNGDENVLAKYEERIKVLTENMNTLIEANAIIYEKTGIVNKSLQEFASNAERTLGEDSSKDNKQ